MLSFIRLFSYGIKVLESTVSFPPPLSIIIFSLTLLSNLSMIFLFSMLFVKLSPYNMVSSGAFWLALD